MKTTHQLTTSILALLLPALVAAQTDANQAPQKSSTIAEDIKNQDASYRKPHVGVIAGVSSPEGSYDAAGEYGITVGYQPLVPFGVSASLTTTKNNQQDQGEDIERTTLLARATLNFTGTTPIIRHSWVGLAAGPVFRPDGTSAAIAPILGFDIPLNENPQAGYMSLGAEASYLVVGDEEADSLGVGAAIKYWY